MSRSQWKFLSTIGSILVVALLYKTGVIPTQAPPLPTSSVPSRTTTTVSLPETTSTTSSVITTSTNAQVIRVVDGDTIMVALDGSTEEFKIRLLGINTPESVDPRRPVQCFGKEASHYLQQWIEGRWVRLDPDPAADERDKYGRLLRNVVTEEGVDVNAKMVEEGYANAYVSFPQNKQRKAQLRRLEQEAKTAQRGLWNPSTCNGQK